MNNSYSKYINIWLLSLATIILIMIAVGGLTRLTESGLSMVDWDPIMGIIPPLSQTDWNYLFNQYIIYLFSLLFLKIFNELTKGS